MNLNMLPQVSARHWHSESEVYTGCDSLITALHCGWSIDGEIVRESHDLSGNHIVVFHFKLMRAGVEATMLVVGNPWAEKIAQQLNIEVLSLSEAHKKLVSYEPIIR